MEAGADDMRAMTPPIRTFLIVPDRTERSTLLAALNSDQRFNVIAEFSSLAEAYSPAETTPPDVVICARGMSGLPEFAMFKALLDMLGRRLVMVGAHDGARSVARTLGLPPSRSPRTPDKAAHVAIARPQRVIAIGASTGGIEALAAILEGYPEDCPPTVVVQHIKADFLNSVVARLDTVCRAHVRAAVPGLSLAPGQVVFAPGLAAHLEIEAQTLRSRLVEGPAVSGHRPSVDRLFHSVSALQSMAVGVLLTGMGRDGASGLGAMRRAGAWTIAQDAATSTVFGMPRVALEEGAVCETLPLPKICRAILSAARIPSEVAS